MDEAIDCARSAVAAARAAEAPIELGRAQLVAGKVYSAAGRDPEAIDYLRAALEGFEATGARGLAAAAAGLLRDLGVPTTGKRGITGGTGLPALSSREREIADLVANGSTNRQIADQLFLSVRTVESHLRRIFDKLGATTRAEVGAEARRDRIVSRAATGE